MSNSDIYNNKEITKVYAKDFKNNNLTGKTGFLVIYAPWCGHCIKQQEMWYNINREFKYSMPIFVLNGEDTKNKKIIEHFDVKAFPTIFIVINGLVEPFFITPNEENIKYYIWSQMLT